jgi:[acyl-carrier-protein] S-malonyltransferase
MKLAFIFPGQGSQSVGMMAAYAQYPVVRATFDEASQALGQDLWALVEQGPAETLGLTVNTQPVMLTADIAVYRAWLAAGGTPPAFAAGHSLGEYAALVASGALSLADAVPLVRYRAQVMQEAVPAGVGAMAAILGLEPGAVIAACAEAAQGEIVEAVNFNTPEQTVIAGHKAAVERAIDAAKARGAKRGMLLPVSAPFHSSLLRSAAEKLGKRLASVSFNAPAITVIHNADVAPAATPEAIRAALTRQAASPVRWVETIQRFAGEGVGAVVECGPGKVLAGMNKRIAAQLASYTLSDGAAIEAARVATHA